MVAAIQLERLVIGARILGIIGGGLGHPAIVGGVFLQSPTSLKAPPRPGLSAS